MNNNWMKFAIVIGIILIVGILIVVFKNALSLSLLPLVGFFSNKRDNKDKQEFEVKIKSIDDQIKASQEKQRLLNINYSNSNSNSKPEEVKFASDMSKEEKEDFYKDIL